MSDETWIKTTRNGRLICYKEAEPDKLYCPECHARVSEFASLCNSCNSNLVQESSTPSDNNSGNRNPSSSNPPQKLGFVEKFIISIIVIVVGNIIRSCIRAIL